MKIGIGVYQLPRYKGMENLDSLLNKFLQNISWGRNTKIVEKHGGSIWGTGGIKKHVQGNIIAIGDAADMINPLGGEGIRHALQSAEFAKEVIIEALKEDDLKLLSRYDNLLSNYVGWRWKVCAAISQIFYVHFFSWKLSDRVVRLMSKLTSEELFDVLFEYKAGPVIRALFR